jgi:hypothetical protein
VHCHMHLVALHCRPRRARASCVFSIKNSLHKLCMRHALHAYLNFLFFISSYFLFYYFFPLSLVPQRGNVITKEQEGSPRTHTRSSERGHALAYHKTRRYCWLLTHSSLKFCCWRPQYLSHPLIRKLLVHRRQGDIAYSARTYMIKWHRRIKKEREKRCY